jgi:hypothetical protein
MRESLQLLSKVLRECGDLTLAARVEDAVSGSDHELDSFLTSNELWGGAGSIADQAGIESGSRTEARRKIERALIVLGREQIRTGRVNPRTAMWVSVFEEWGKTGVV